MTVVEDLKNIFEKAKWSTVKNDKIQRTAVLVNSQLEDVEKDVLGVVEPLEKQVAVIKQLCEGELFGTKAEAAVRKIAEMLK